MSLPRALLGCAPFVLAGMLFVGRSVVCVRALRGGRGWRFGMLTDCGCAAVFDGMCGWDASDNGIGDAGAVALAKALESGQCQLESLDLNGESVCLAACGAGLCAFRSGWHASFGRWRVCVRSGGRVWRLWMLSDCVCPAAVF